MPTNLGQFTATLNSWGAAFTGLAGPMLVQSLAVTAVLLVLVWACSRTRAAFRYALLSLVLVKLLLPPSFSLPTGLGYWLRVPDRQPGLPQIDLGTIGGSFQLNRPGSGHFKLSRDALLLLSWMAGMGVLAFLIAARYRRVSGMEGTPAPAELQRELDACQKELGLKRSLSLELSSSCASPAVAGLLRPVVLIPKPLADSLSRSQLRHVLLHELTHVKRGDLWVNHLQVALQVLHWYNPLLWLVNALIRRVREEAVDQTVMVALGQEAESYPSTLVAVAKLAFARPSFSLGFIGIMESKAAFKRRLARLVQNQVPKNAKLGWLRIGLVVATAALLLPMARPQSSDNAKAPATQSLEARPVAEHGSENAGITPLRLEFTQALQAHGMTYEQFRQKYAGDRDLKPGELETLATQWLVAQKDGAKTNAPSAVTRIVIKHIGPAVAPDDQIKAKIGSKVGTPFTATQADADVRNLYATGLFANVRVAQERTSEGTALTYVVQERPRLAEIAFEGNTKIGDAELREKLASRVGEPLDERKLFADAQTIQEAYQRLGFSVAVVRYKISNDEKTGRSAVTFQITAKEEGAVTPAPILSPKGRQFITTNSDGGIRIWDLTTGHPVQTPVYSVSFSPDGRLIAGTGDPVVNLREVPSTNQVASTQAQNTVISHVVFSPDGKWLITVGTNQPVKFWDTNGTVRLWDAVTGKEILAAPPGRQPIDSDPQFKKP